VVNSPLDGGGGQGFLDPHCKSSGFLVVAGPSFPIIHRPRNDLSVTFLNGCYGLQLKTPNGPGKGRKEVEKEVENLEVRALAAKVAVLPTGIHHHLLGLHLVLLGGLVPGSSSMVSWLGVLMGLCQAPPVSRVMRAWVSRTCSVP
jgi:hypothetical protein